MAFCYVVISTNVVKVSFPVEVHGGAMAKCVDAKDLV